LLRSDLLDFLLLRPSGSNVSVLKKKFPTIHAQVQEVPVCSLGWSRRKRSGV